MIIVNENQILSPITGGIVSDNAVDKVTFNVNEWNGERYVRLDAESNFTQTPNQDNIKIATTSYNIPTTATAGNKYHKSQWAIDFTQTVSASILPYSKSSEASVEAKFDPSRVGIDYYFGFYGKKQKIKFVGDDSSSINNVQYQITRENADIENIINSSEYITLEEPSSSLSFVSFDNVSPYMVEDAGTIIDINGDSFDIEYQCSIEKSITSISTNVLPKYFYYLSTLKANVLTTAIPYAIDENNSYKFIPEGIAIYVIKLDNTCLANGVKLHNVGNISIGSGKEELTINDEIFTNNNIKITGSGETFIHNLACKIIEKNINGNKQIQFDCAFEDYVDENGVVVYRRKNGEFFKQGDLIKIEAYGETSRDKVFSGSKYDIIQSTLKNENGHKYINIIANEHRKERVSTPQIYLIQQQTYWELRAYSSTKDAYIEATINNTTNTIRNGDRILTINWDETGSTYTVDISVKSEFQDLTPYNTQIVVDVENRKCYYYNVLGELVLAKEMSGLEDIGVINVTGVLTDNTLKLYCSTDTPSAVIDVYSSNSPYSSSGTYIKTVNNGDIFASIPYADSYLSKVYILRAFSPLKNESRYGVLASIDSSEDRYRATCTKGMGQHTYTIELNNGIVDERT